MTIPPDWMDLDSRLEISELSDKGDIIKTIYGPTKREQLAAHNKGECDALCSFCYTEACEYLHEQKGNQDSA